MSYTQPNAFAYGAVRTASWLAAKLVFGRKILRNEIRRVKGPYVVIANHQAALDFVNLIGLTHRRLSFVISNSICSTLPCRPVVDNLGLIPKQQFQTTPRDLKRMKEVIDAGQPLVIYPAGLMCEDGLSTPIPSATCKFLKWLGADIYVARTCGSYYVMPKWSKGLRPGRTTLDVYKLVDKEQLAAMELPELQRITDEALLFDACREQEVLRARCWNSADIRGLQHVLYACPHCGAEFTVEAQGKNILRCTACGFAQKSDALGFLHRINGDGEEIRYISDWSRRIRAALHTRLRAAAEPSLETPVRIRMIGNGEHKFTDAGEGTVRLTPRRIELNATIHGEPLRLEQPLVNIPSLPFSPGRHFEIQHGSTIYRCLPQDGRIVMKFIHMLQLFHENLHADAAL